VRFNSEVAYFILRIRVNCAIMRYINWHWHWRCCDWAVSRFAWWRFRLRSRDDRLHCYWVRLLLWQPDASSWTTFGRLSAWVYRWRF